MTNLDYMLFNLKKIRSSYEHPITRIGYKHYSYMFIRVIEELKNEEVWDTFDEITKLAIDELVTNFTWMAKNRIDYRDCKNRDLICGCICIIENKVAA